MPVPRDRADAGYFAPLAGLRGFDDSALYLGLIHHDDREGDRLRIEAARPFAARFGVAAECGWGRTDPARVPGLLENHRAAAELLAGRVTRARRSAAKALSGEVAALLKSLAMPHARFTVAIEPGELSPLGADLVELRLSANPGEEPKAISRVASGGELSRVMLALKRVVAGRHPVRSYVFDEIDAGIGGAVAERVGRTLAMVAKGGHQVLCVTHLPQIAALADEHVQVRKSVTGGRTRVEADRLDPAGREAELARMLGGEEITEATRAHAREMLAAGDPQGRGRRIAA